jgi:hypothetical protein
LYTSVFHAVDSPSLFVLWGSFVSAVFRVRTARRKVAPGGL